MVVTTMTTGSAAAAEPDVIGVYLTWTRDPSTTMTINWVDLYADSSLTVRYRPLPQATTDATSGGASEATTEPAWSIATAERRAVGPSVLQRRFVELTGLEPDTVYEFGIGDSAPSAADAWRFRTMPRTLDRPVTFVTGGDMMHSRAMVDAMNRQAAKREPDFALLGGDLAYANGVTASRWIDWLQSWTRAARCADRRLLPIVAAIGNHEVRGGYGKTPAEAPYFYSLFTLPEDRSYYALDFGDYLSLLVLDSGHTQPIAGDQALWLDRAMAARRASTFLFACWHYPAYGTTKAPENGLPIDAEISRTLREEWVPTLERYGVTAIFENDHHNFKRSRRLLRHEPNEAGLLYLGDGAWGVTTREVPEPEVAWWLEKAEPRNHLWHVTIRPDGSSSLVAVDAEGTEFDRVDLERPRTAENP